MMKLCAMLCVLPMAVAQAGDCTADDAVCSDLDCESADCELWSAIIIAIAQSPQHTSKPSPVAPPPPLPPARTVPACHVTRSPAACDCCQRLQETERGLVCVAQASRASAASPQRRPTTGIGASPPSPPASARRPTSPRCVTTTSTTSRSPWTRAPMCARSA